MRVIRDILARIKWPLLLTLWSFIAPIGLQQVEIGFVTFKLGKDKKQRKEKIKEAFMNLGGNVQAASSSFTERVVFATVISVIIRNTSPSGVFDVLLFMRSLLRKRVTKKCEEKNIPARRPFMFCCGWIANWENAIQSMAVTFIALQRPGLSIFRRNSHAFLNIWQKTAADHRLG